MHSRAMICVCCMLTIIDFSSILFIHILVCLPWEFVKVYHNIVYGPGACHLLYWFKNLTRMANIMQLGHKQCYHKLEQILRGLYVIDKPPPQVFTPELSRVLPVNTCRGWFDWLVLLQAYKLLLCFLPLLCSLFYQTGMLRWATSGSRSLLLLLVSQQTSHQSLHAFHVPWPSLFSHLKCSVEQVLTVDLSARVVGAGRLLIARSMNNITGPTDARTEPGYKLNCTWRDMVGGVRDWWGERLRSCSNYSICHVLTTQFADSACSNYMICWPGWYSRFTQYNHWAVPLICMAVVVQISGNLHNINSTYGADALCLSILTLFQHK